MTPHHNPVVDDTQDGEEESAPRQTRRTDKNRQVSSSFLVAASVLLGVLLAAGSIIGVLGKAFYVARDEYTTQALQYTQDKTVIEQTLGRVDKALARQEGALQRVFESVQELKIDIAKHTK